MSTEYARYHTAQKREELLMNLLSCEVFITCTPTFEQKVSHPAFQGETHDS